MFKAEIVLNLEQHNRIKIDIFGADIGACISQQIIEFNGRIAISFLRFQVSSPSCRLSELEAVLVISRSYGRGIPTPSLFSPPLRSGDPGGPPSITP